MWPGPKILKEVLNIVIIRILAPYVENFNIEDAQNGVEKGHLVLHNLRLKKGLLEKLPILVQLIHGHLGTLRLSLNWQNFGNEAIDVEIEDVYLLFAPPSDLNTDTAEQQSRDRLTKLERLRVSELLWFKFEAEFQELDTSQLYHAIFSFMTTLISCLVLTVRNVHVRYEDRLSVPKLFAAGVSLAGFTVISDGSRFSVGCIDDMPREVRKLVQLEFLALYLNTDTTSLGDLSHDEFVGKCSEYVLNHEVLGSQFILKPVHSHGTITINATQKCDDDRPRFDIQLLVDDVVVSLSDSQYHSFASLIEMYHRCSVQKRFQGYRSQQSFTDNPSKVGPVALWKLAADAILREVRDRQRRWTWAWFVERRDDRRRYIDVWTRNEAGNLDPKDISALEGLETKLSYDDLWLYRAMARTRSDASRTSKRRRAQLSLWSVVEALRSATINTRVLVQLECGSFALRKDTLRRSIDVLSTTVEEFRSTFEQRLDSCEVVVSLANIIVRDVSDPNTPYPLVVYVKEHESTKRLSDHQEPCFFCKVRSDPRNPRAESLVTVNARNIEIVYNPSYLELLCEFFRLPKTRTDSFRLLVSWLMRSCPFFRWVSVLGQTMRTIFSLRLQDESQPVSAGAEDSPFSVQLSASVEARIAPSTSYSCPQ